MLIFSPSHTAMAGLWIRCERRRAPSDNVARFAHTMCGNTSRNDAKLEKPQSAPAMTLSSPTTEA